MDLLRVQQRIWGFRRQAAKVGVRLTLSAALLFAPIAHAEVTAASVDGGLVFNGQYQKIKPIIIDDQPGGIVDQALYYYKLIRASGVPVILRGICVSACGFVLILPTQQVCVEPTAALGFHLASDDEGNSLPEYSHALYNRYFPKPVLDWLASKKLTQKVQYMDADTIVKLGIFPACQVIGGPNGNEKQTEAAKVIRD